MGAVVVERLVVLKKEGLERSICHGRQREGGLRTNGRGEGEGGKR